MKPLRVLALAATAALVASAAFAADDGAVPQMDHTWYPNQILWLAISFVLLYVVVARSISPTVGKVLTERDHAISRAIHEAEYAKHTAESTKSQYESAGFTARHKATDLLAKVQAESARDAADASTKLRHDIELKSQKADARIADAVKKAKADMAEATASLAEAMVSKLMTADAPAQAKPRLKA